MGLTPGLGSGSHAAHWRPQGRDLLPDLLALEWDLLIISGGITGAGILLAALND